MHMSYDPSVNLIHIKYGIIRNAWGSSNFIFIYCSFFSQSWGNGNTSGRHHSDSSDPSGIRFPVVSRRPGARCVDRSLYDPLAAANVLF